MPNATHLTRPQSVGPVLGMDFDRLGYRGIDWGIEGHPQILETSLSSVKYSLE